MSTQHETDVVKEIRSEYKYGFSNPDEAKDYFFKSGRGCGVRKLSRPGLRTPHALHAPVKWPTQAPGSAKGSSHSNWRAV